MRVCRNCRGRGRWSWPRRSAAPWWPKVTLSPPNCRSPRPRRRRWRRSAGKSRTRYKRRSRLIHRPSMFTAIVFVVCLKIPWLECNLRYSEQMREYISDIPGIPGSVESYSLNTGSERFTPTQPGDEITAHSQYSEWNYVNLICNSPNWLIDWLGETWTRFSQDRMLLMFGFIPRSLVNSCSTRNSQFTFSIDNKCTCTSVWIFLLLNVVGQIWTGHFCLILSNIVIFVFLDFCIFFYVCKWIVYVYFCLQTLLPQIGPWRDD